jgi:hypothetical protein
VGNWYIRGGEIFYATGNYSITDNIPDSAKKMRLTSSGEIINEGSTTHTNGGTFIVYQNGGMQTNNIIATGGSVGGWTIGEKSIFKKNASGTAYNHYWGDPAAVGGPGGNSLNYVFKIGSKFAVQNDGTLYATNGVFSGSTFKAGGVL